MFISVYRFSVCFVLLSSFFVVKSEEIEIVLRKLNGPCSVLQHDKNIAQNSNFTLKVTSDFLICEDFSTWQHGEHKSPVNMDRLHANISIVYRKSESSHRNKLKYSTSINYTFSYTGKADLNMNGNWVFKFCVVKFDSQNPLYHTLHKRDCTYSNCSTSIKIYDAVTGKGNGVERGLNTPPASGSPFNSVITISSAAGAIILSLTAYIIYMHCKFRRSSGKKTMHRSETTETVFSHDNDRSIDIAKRPPLPLPNEINDEGPRTARSPALQRRDEQNMRIAAAVSPIPVRHQNDRIRSPLPLQPRTPKISRKTARTCPMTPVLQKREVQNVRIVAAVAAVPPRPVRPQYNQTPPILSPKPNKMPLQAEHQKERRDSSDDEWQYEKLQPLDKYINNRH